MHIDDIDDMSDMDEMEIEIRKKRPKLFPNPLKTEGFAFLEFATDDKKNMEDIFLKFGMTKVGTSKTNDVDLYKQEEVLFFLNNCGDENVKKFVEKHGSSVSAMGFYVASPKYAMSEAIKRGATGYQAPSDSMWNDVPAIEGIGGSKIYFVDRHNRFLDKFVISEQGAIDCYLLGNKLDRIDHVTHNVYRGNMDTWADFYTKIFAFREIRYFDIDGKITGLFSKAMISPCGKIKIPINESKDDKSQVEEFLREFNGEGIQHIAVTSKNIFTTVEKTAKAGIKFLDTPDTYYELIDKRLPNNGEDLEQLKKHKILIDGVTTPERKILLQIFTQNIFGPIFFEIIQRKGDEGFGEGNFKALFDSIELDQIRRGVI